MAELRLEPCPLHELAEYMRDRTWVDLRVPEVGLLERVRIIEIKVYVTREEIVVHQQWVDDDGRHHVELTFDSEAIWQAQPTGCDLFDVKPPASVKRHAANEEEAVLVDHIIEAAKFVFGAKGRDLLESNEWPHMHHRHATIIVVYEMTDLSPKDICVRYFGYRSQQPWVTAAAYKAKQDDDFRAAVKNVGEAAEQRIGSAPRRSRGFTHYFKPVLA